jgi:hypothetical protein
VSTGGTGPEPHIGSQECVPFICLLVLEVLNGAQTLKGALHQDGHPCTQGLALFHAMGKKGGSEVQ